MDTSVILTPIRVGALVLVAITSFIVFYVAVTKNTLSKRDTYGVTAVFSDASGLAEKTRIQVAGIDVGRIDKILLEGNQARVYIRIRKDVVLYSDSQIAKVSESLLGDFKLDIMPGNKPPALGENGEIGQVQSKSDLNALQGEMRVIAANVREITETLKNVIASKNGEASLKEIISQVESATRAVNAIAQNISRTVDANEKNVNDVLHNVASLSSKLNHIADSVAEVIGTNQGDMKASVASLRQAMDKVNESLVAITSTTKKIDEGQGTIGKLINDPTLHDNVNETVENANSFIKKLTGMTTEVDLRSEYHIPFRPDDVLIDPSGYLKNYVQVKLKPKPDKWYQFELISDPRGRFTRQVTTSRRTPGDVLENPQRIDDTTTISFNSLKISLMLAKRFYFATFRFGIIEDTGGAGFNLNFFNDSLEIRTDLFQFGSRDRFGNPMNPRLKSFVSYEPLKHMYLHAGVDDPFNTRFMTFTVGAGVRFTDDDLSALLGLAGAAAR